MLKPHKKAVSRRSLIKFSSASLSVLYAPSLLVAASTAAEEAYGSDHLLIREQFNKYFVEKGVDDHKVTKLLSSLSGKGTWGDVFYESKRGGSWEAHAHLKRLTQMSVAYRTNTSRFFKHRDLKSAIILAQNHWVNTDYQNYNWWYMRIGIPWELSKSLILMGEDLPNETLKNAKVILDRAHIDMTGQNKVWLSGVVFTRGLLFGNEQDMQNASKSIWDELIVTQNEGIQIDGSFHQHGPQLQFGNYGRSFGESMVMWASILRGSEYAIPQQKARILGNYLLDGPRWTLWKGLMDLNATGRQFYQGSEGHPVKAYIHILDQISKMQLVAPALSNRLQDALNPKKPLIGHKTLWRSAFAIHRRPNWYASLRMSSTRVIGTETANYENMQGRLFGDGVLLPSLSGKEYYDIAPLWNWRRLPGITADQKIIEVYPTSFNTEYGRSAFAGGINQNGSGVSAMELMRGNIHANKAWFFEDNAIVCLGSDIHGHSHGDVYTSVQQSFLTSEVESSIGLLTAGSHELKQNSWVLHANIGYELLNKSHCLVNTVEGNWNTIFHTFGDKPAKGDVFSLWVNHGKSPENESYAYIIYPDVNKKTLKRRIKTKSIKILANTPDVAAIESTSGFKAVFFKPGSVSTTSGTTITSSHPCLVSIHKDKIVVSDPTRYLRSIQITVQNKELDITLPKGELAGSQIELTL